MLCCCMRRRACLRFDMGSCLLVALLTHPHRSSFTRTLTHSIKLNQTQSHVSAFQAWLASCSALALPSTSGAPFSSTRQASVATSPSGLSASSVSVSPLVAHVCVVCVSCMYRLYACVLQDASTKAHAAKQHCLFSSQPYFAALLSVTAERCRHHVTLLSPSCRPPVSSSCRPPVAFY